ncbi:putative sugar uptake ABC transporter periplasmic solute-binding protein precursor [Stappia aggregata IAM 12614]|uniref:Putative sugar uptake ABC transporter periplasmic solute-binding protein n=1 Tax=Roseibium aggregatum (strain ATCC 25650 / DSM 13394 / JCM 20685 / NBRC 16684 / NCIMB 2208 / IAM 12614 / B1) TaxID=384765 RepID=A0P1Q6_ROSAI|nr:putative sugar uptake ABC transporter periplasmic solute-binding protein precursor [Stappia aggregata IAM 12614] [Roseibium aggregatum IAM 12614]
MIALASTAAADPVELDLWTIDDPGEYHYVMADEFMAQHPDIKINVRTVQFEDMVNDLARGVATGDAPDITYIDNPEVALFASRGLLLDLKPYIEQSDIVNAEDIFPGPLSSVSYEGGIYGIPRGANTIALYYNADMYRAAGLDPDTPPRTWDELYEAAKVLTKPEDNVYGLAFSAVATEEGTFQFLPWLQMTGGNYDNVDTEGAARALSLWKKILDEGLASPDTLIRGQWDSTGTFNAGTAAMSISGPWELPRMSSEAKFDFRAALLPVPQEGADRASALGEGDNVILASTDNPDEAFLFLEFLYENMDRVWNDFGYLPASKVEVKDPKYPEIYAVFEESMKYARNRGPHPQWPRISKAIQTAIQSTLTGQATPEDALAAAQTSIDKILK